MSDAADRLPSDAERAARFRQEARDFNLVFRCDACVHFMPHAAACSLGYPANLLDETSDACFTETGAWRFCKYFELT